MGYFPSLASLNTFLLILVTQNRPIIPGKTKRIPLGGFPYFGAKKLPVYPKINDFPVPRFESKKHDPKNGEDQTQNYAKFWDRMRRISPPFFDSNGVAGEIGKSH